MRQQWFLLFIFGIVLLTCLFAAVEAEEEWTEAKKKQFVRDNQGKIKEARDAWELKKYIYFGTIGGCSVSAIICAIFFILACKGCICKSKPAEVHQTLDVL